MKELVIRELSDAELHAEITLRKKGKAGEFDFNPYDLSIEMGRRKTTQIMQEQYRKKYREAKEKKRHEDDEHCCGPAGCGG